MARTVYTGQIRTTLSRTEKEYLKSNASKRGMTLTGLCDAILRAELKKEGAYGTADSGTEGHQGIH